jgi:hypothetical protein
VERAAIPQHLTAADEEGRYQRRGSGRRRKSVSDDRTAENYLLDLGMLLKQAALEPR